MERTINVLGQLVVVADADDSRYLTLMSPCFEPDTLSVLASCCRPEFNVLDVGANIGLTAIAFGRLCPRGRVFAIEASPETFKYLQKNVAGAGLENVHCENMAAAAAAGEVTLSHMPGGASGAFTSQKYEVGGKYVHHTVRAGTIDDYVKTLDVDRFDFMKVDVKGFELEVLRGAAETIQRSKPILYCEVNHWCLNIFQRLSVPDFIDEIYRLFPHVFAIHSDLQFLDLSTPDSRHRFFYEHTVNFAFINLLCGFDKNSLLSTLNTLAIGHQARLDCDSARVERDTACAELEAARRERDAARTERDTLKSQRDALAAQCDALASQREVLLKSRSWRLAAPLRRLAAWKRQLLGSS